MSKKYITILQYLVFFGLGVFLVWWQLRSMKTADKADFITALQQANYWLVLPILGMSILSHISRSMRWKLLLQPMGYNPRLSNTFCATMVGYLANSAVPRLGEVVKCTIVARYEKIPADKLIGSIIIERMFDLVCYAVLIATTVLIEWKTIGAFAQNTFMAVEGGFNWVKLGLLLLCMVTFVLGLAWVFVRLKKNKIIAAIHHFAIGIKEGILVIKKLQRRKAFLLHSVFIWMMYLLQIYVGFFAIEATANLGLGTACSVLTLATFAMILTPGGIGAFPIAVQKVLLLYGIGLSVGNAFGWLIWGVSTGIIFIAGFTCLIVLPYLNKKNIETPRPYFQ